ncbi:hypothetical protein [Rhodococcus sp. NPDC057529]|uniref:hypothetical protein n=1 Tax=Rhodococcus sp. NPDC057529 TaxID=3346158 RepID=UPI003670B6BE
MPATTVASTSETPAPNQWVWTTEADLHTASGQLCAHWLSTSLARICRTRPAN